MHKDIYLAKIELINYTYSIINFKKGLKDRLVDHIPHNLHKILLMEGINYYNQNKKIFLVHNLY